MIENASYEGELIEKIREEYGTKRRVLERSSDASTFVQDELRLGISESGQSSGTDLENSAGNEGDVRESSGNEQPAKRRYQRKGRADTKADKSDGSTNGHSDAINGTLQRNATGELDDEQKKPAGLGIKPNAKERKARQEADQQAAREAKRERPDKK